MTTKAPHLPDWLVQRIFEAGSLAPLAEFAPARRKQRLRSTKIVETKESALIDAKRASTILRDEYRHGYEARRKFIVRHFLKVDNSVAVKIAKGEGGGVGAAMADNEAVAAMRRHVKSLIDNTVIRLESATSDS
ncbi:hypothetical protein IVB41_08930 [Bradyrhizobium sp. 44]|uniref:hypothetical protein n=1 Tax=Bradyrhizobium sp. 44 TaxID=2782675 RepID=UPI001FF7C81B|nr:hypothetical protein [Bradyrhizobium sp. 44]MCK1284061.1 hypothetical protein [Bradyrhizobium sp. 44]